MEVARFRHRGLGNTSYLVEVAPGSAIAVDADRNVARYLRELEERGWELLATVDTHVHADFVAGALELRDRTGARVHLPQGAGPGFLHSPLRAGEHQRLGDAELQVLPTPGHSPEHVSYVITGAAGDPPHLLSGGALIAGGAARTDLMGADRTEELTRAAFRTAHEAFRELPDETLLLPTHGAGSFCSAGDAREPTILGAERATNPVMLADDEERFVSDWPAAFPATPAYFRRMRAVNLAGPRPLREIRRPAPLRPAAFDAARRSGALVVDCRRPDDYRAGHLEGALAIPFRDAFSTWLGWLAPANARLLLVVDGIDPDAVVDACLLVGYEAFEGVLDGGVPAWTSAGLPTTSLSTIEPEDALPLMYDGAQPLDVREPDEHELGHLARSELAPLGSLPERLGQLPAGRPLLTYCASGFRSVSAASILERAGVGPVVELRGGYGAWQHVARD